MTINANMAAPMSFIQAKKTRLKTQDLSKKGSIDEEILDLVNYINDAEYFCTTSSCSGRIIIICEGSDVITKKGCQWLYVSHKPTQLAAIETSLKDLQGKAVLKYEPFILHVQCRSLDDAKLMHVVAVESGFRNSGITIGRAGKVMVAVRSTHGLEVPLSNGFKLLVSSEYLAFLVEQANTKLTENSKRITRFYSNLSKRLDTYAQRINSHICNHCGRTRAKQHSRCKTSDMGTGGMDTNEADSIQTTSKERGESIEDRKHTSSNNSCSAELTEGRGSSQMTACADHEARQLRTMDTSENRTGARESNCMETDDSDGGFGFELFT